MCVVQGCYCMGGAGEEWHRQQGRQYAASKLPQFMHAYRGWCMEHPGACMAGMKDTHICWFDETRGRTDPAGHCIASLFLQLCRQQWVLLG